MMFFLVVWGVFFFFLRFLGVLLILVADPGFAAIYYFQPFS